MNCDTFRLQIDAYAYGALSSSERAVFEEHRATCANCQIATERAQQLDSLLQTEFPKLAAATSSEQVSLRETVLEQIGIFSEERAAQVAWRRMVVRSVGTGLGLLLALAATLILLPGQRQSASAAEIVDRARSAVEEHRGMDGVLHWEADWSQRFPTGDQFTRTFEIWFSFDDPGRYRLTQRDSDGRVVSEMVRDGVNHMWQVSRSVADDGREHIMVDEIVLSPKEMEELGSWYVPSPFLDDLDRFTEVLSTVQKVAETNVAGRSTFILRSQLYGFGQPGEGNRIDPITSTVQLVVDAETYWVLDRTEWVSVAGRENEVIAGVVQRTRRFEVLPLEQIPPRVFTFTPPPQAEVRTVDGIAGYYAPSPDAAGLEDAAGLTSFTVVMPSILPDDLETRSFFRYTCPPWQTTARTLGRHTDPAANALCQGQSTGRVDSLGIVFVGDTGLQAFLLEYQQTLQMGQAARVVNVGLKQGWLVPDPVDGHRFSLYLVEPRPDPGPDGRPWPGSVELQAWGLSLDAAVAMLASLEPYAGDEENGD